MWGACCDRSCSRCPRPHAASAHAEPEKVVAARTATAIDSPPPPPPPPLGPLPRAAAPRVALRRAPLRGRERRRRAASEAFGIAHRGCVGSAHKACMHVHVPASLPACVSQRTQVTLRFHRPRIPNRTKERREAFRIAFTEARAVRLDAHRRTCTGSDSLNFLAFRAFSPTPVHLDV